MQKRAVEVTAADGEVVEAELVICSQCEGEVWTVFVVKGQNHAHVQCMECGTSFCAGAQCVVEEGAT